MDSALIVELVAVFLNVLYVIFAARRKVICWLFGGLASVLSIWLFIKAQLYAESGLYLFYVVMAVVGFVQWNKSQNSQSQVKVNAWTMQNHLQVIGLGVLLSLGIAYLLQTYTEAAFPYLDALTTVFSVIATYMTVKRVLSNWVYWVIIDLLSVYLYHSRSLDYYAILMIFMTILAVYGYVTWFKEWKAEVQNA